MAQPSAFALLGSYDEDKEKKKKKKDSKVHNLCMSCSFVFSEWTPIQEHPLTTETGALESLLEPQNPFQY